MSSFRRSKKNSFIHRKSKKSNASQNTSTTQTVFLHGCLLIEIRSARNLPDMDSWLSKLVDKNDVTDPFIDVSIGKAKLIKTSVIMNDLNPVWNETYRIEACHYGEFLTFEVKDKDHMNSEYIGSTNISLSSLLSGETKQGWFPIIKSNGVPYDEAELHLKLDFTPTSAIKSGYEINCYFPARHNCCSVTLYQDAHSLDIQQMPHFEMLDPPHHPRSCWEDLHQALLGAKHLICITGWGFQPQLHLIRGEKQEADAKTLGEILIDKSNEGVKVYIMIWDERSSNCLIGETGFMGNNDEATFKYFKDTNVKCALAPREMSVNEFTDILNNQFSSSFYTHHQKSVVCDAEDDSQRTRKLVAFIGGLDLTGGRYDTPNHELFSTLLDVHYGDFRNSDVKSIPPRQGPREPWHDIHSKVEGPIAYDIYLNFKERWLKQGRKDDDGLIDEIDNELIGIDFGASGAQDSGSNWSCQLFRSITSDSAHFLQAEKCCLNTKKGRYVDSSIAQAYIQIIRNAQKFIYIENQYFLGSAYAWSEDCDVNCQHTIPCEIVHKIVEQIHLKQRFAVYIVIPMFPNGNPSSAPVQQILHYQYRTMEMMYKKIGHALQETGSDTHPTDWLLFLCLGKREESGPHLDKLDEATEPMAKVFRQTLRFPIYVHSKMMIVDDTYILLGSANINERSLSGSRDTEMAVGCWQPLFDASNPVGDISRFRMALWTEHFRCFDSVMKFPSTLDCIRSVKERTRENWDVYVGESGNATPGHLLIYPLHITESGDIQNLPNVVSFPDFPESSKITGSMSTFIPQKLAT